MDRKRKHIPFESYLTPDLLFRRTAEGNFPEALRGRFVEWFFCGTAATYRAIRALRLMKTDVVLMPDYNCGIEVSAVLEAGARIEFYKVRHDASIDIEDIDRKARPPVKAIFIIHYFGFPQPLEPVLEIAKIRNLFLIEDCAHSLYSKYEGRNLGTIGDLGIFSPRKTLPLTDGGALSYNLSLDELPEPLASPDRLHTTREVLHSFSHYYSRKNTLMGFGMGRILRIAAEVLYPGHRAEKPLSEIGSQDFESVNRRLGWGMSPLSRRLLGITDHLEVIRRRRENYFHLLRHLPCDSRMNPLHENLPDGVCPMFFPLIVKERDKVYEMLASKNIGVFRYWIWRHPILHGISYRHADYLRSNLLALPLHQDLDEEDIEFLEDAIKRISVG